MVRLSMFFGAQSLVCRVSEEDAIELVCLFAPDLYTTESDD